MYYNIFRAWWVLHTDLDSQAGAGLGWRSWKEPPMAWADGRDFTTPDQLPNNAWQVGRDLISCAWRNTYHIHVSTHCSTVYH